jgi:hypothetical protein
MQSPGRDLILIDSTPIKEKVWKEYESTKKKIDSAKKNILVYQTKVRPEFQAWFQSEFSNLLQQMNELRSRYQDKEDLVREVFAYSEFHQVSAALAYFRIMERRKTPEGEREWDAFYDEEEIGYWEEEDQDQSEYIHSDEDSDEESEPDSSRTNANLKDSESSEPKQNSEQEEILRTFRMIARVLHPDKNPNLSPEDLQNWQKALDAYSEKNLFILKDILTWIRMERIKIGEEVSLSEIAAFIKRLVKDLKNLQKEIRSYKKRPDWNFHQKTKTQIKKLKLEMGEELKTEIIRKHYEIDQLDKVIRSWKNFAANLY